MQTGPIPPYMFPGMPMTQAPFNVFNKIPMAPPLYIGDLDENTHEETLHDIFSKFGPLHFVRIMRDPATGKSRGFGYVNFLYPRDADTARQFAQYEKVGRKNIRIMFKRNVRDLPPDANIYVKNLDPSVTVKDLYNHFLQNEVDRRGGNTEKGPSSAVIASVKIASNAEGQSLGYGYVQFEKAEDAQRALEELQGTKLKESELVLERFVPKDKREGTAKKNIYIKNLPTNKSEEDLDKFVKDMFSKFGEIDSQKVKKHQKHNQFSAFVCYKEESAAEKALEHFRENPPTFEGADAPVYVNWHQAKNERTRDLKRQHQQQQNDKNLFLKNLKHEATEADLKNAFQQYGKINSVACKEWESKDSQKKAKFAFVAFDNSDDATRALNEGINSQEIRSLFLVDAKPYIGLHQEKGKRKEYLHTQMKWKSQGANMFNAMDPMRGMQMQMGAGRKFPPFPPMMNPQQLRNFGRGGPQGKQFKQAGYKPNVGGQRGGVPGGPGKDMRQDRRGPMGGQQFNKKPAQQKTPQQLPQSTPATAITVQNLRGKLNEFLSLEIDKQRQILGELLFPLIKNIAGDNYAPKITGMLIDLTVLEVTEILEFLENPSLLQERVTEAIELINSEQQ